MIETNKIINGDCDFLHTNRYLLVWEVKLTLIMI
jgi:hypothetical protein